MTEFTWIRILGKWKELKFVSKTCDKFISVSGRACFVFSSRELVGVHIFSAPVGHVIFTLVLKALR